MFDLFYTSIVNLIVRFRNTVYHTLGIHIVDIGISWMLLSQLAAGHQYSIFPSYLEVFFYFSDVSLYFQTT